MLRLLSQRKATKLSLLRPRICLNTPELQSTGILKLPNHTDQQLLRRAFELATTFELSSVGLVVPDPTASPLPVLGPGRAVRCTLRSLFQQGIVPCRCSIAGEEWGIQPKAQHHGVLHLHLKGGNQHSGASLICCEKLDLMQSLRKGLRL